VDRKPGVPPRQQQLTGGSGWWPWPRGSQGGHSPTGEGGGRPPATRWRRVSHRARRPAETIGWPYANRPPFSTALGLRHNRSLRPDRSRSAPPGFVLGP
jgi:hypothetical protein